MYVFKFRCNTLCVENTNCPLCSIPLIYAITRSDKIGLRTRFNSSANTTLHTKKSRCKPVFCFTSVLFYRYHVKKRVPNIKYILLAVFVDFALYITCNSYEIIIILPLNHSFSLHRIRLQKQSV